MIFAWASFAVIEYGRYLLILTRNGMEKRIYWIFCEEFEIEE